MVDPLRDRTAGDYASSTVGADAGTGRPANGQARRFAAAAARMRDFGGVATGLLACALLGTVGAHGSVRLAIAGSLVLASGVSIDRLSAVGVAIRRAVAVASAVLWAAILLASWRIGPPGGALAVVLAGLLLTARTATSVDPWTGPAHRLIVGGTTVAVVAASRSGDVPAALLAAAILMEVLLGATRSRAAAVAAAAAAAADNGSDDPPPRLDGASTAADAAAVPWRWESDRNGALRIFPPVRAGDAEGADTLFDWHCWLHAGCARTDTAGLEFRRLRRAFRRRQPFDIVTLPLPVAGGGSAAWTLSGMPVVAHGAFAGYRGTGILAVGSPDPSGHDDPGAPRPGPRIDPLTGLADRDQLLAEAARALAEAHPLSLLVLDLDQFNAFNEEHGRLMGDALLRAIAGRLLKGVRTGDLVARLGDDEFGVLARGGDRASTLERARRIEETLGEPFQIDGSTLTTNAAIGAALSVDCGGTADDLLYAAEIALRRGTDDRPIPGSIARGSSIRVFEPALRVAERDRRTMRHDLADALERGELRLGYQPIVDIATGAIRSCEALARWSHPVRGDVPASDFIPVAEQSGLISRLSHWALIEACREAATWPKPVTIAVNVSTAQLRGTGLLRSVEAALALSGLGPERLELEVTESMLLEPSGNAIRTLAQLRERGIRVALDDFGTGYASLSTLLAFDFDRVKIDCGFTSKLRTRPTALAIVQTILDLGERLGIAITVEGVEDEGQLELLGRLGCTQVQGFLFSGAVPGARMRALLTGGPLARAAHNLA